MSRNCSERGLAALFLTVTTVSSVITPQAQAFTGVPSAPDTVRYARLTECPKKPGTGTASCDTWTLVMRSGKTIKLIKGNTGETTLLGISADGRVAHYVKDGRLVVHDVGSGRIRPLPGTAATAPRGLTLDDVGTTLSPDGSIVEVTYLEDGDEDKAVTLPSVVANVETGKVFPVSESDSVLSFSPGGKHVLVDRSTGTDTGPTTFAVLDADGRTTASRIVPKAVSDAYPVALAADGRTVVLIATVGSDVWRLRTYDLASGTLTKGIRLGVFPKEKAQSLFWDTTGALTFWSVRADKGGWLGAVKRTVGIRTGAMRAVDSFGFTKGSWWELPGGASMPVGH